MQAFRALALSVVVACASGASLPSFGQAWSADADLASAGAAAAIVEAQVCEGPEAAARARDAAAVQLAQWAQATDPVQERSISQYLTAATNQKVRALWQAQLGRQCGELDNLRALANGVGFRTTR